MVAQGPPPLQASRYRDLLVDFDAEASIVEQGRGDLVLEPALDVTTNERVIDVAVYLPGAELPVAAFSPNGDVMVALDETSGTVIFIDPDTGEVISTVPVEEGAREMAYSPDGGALIVANSGSPFDLGNTVVVIATSDLSVTTLTVGEGPSRIEFRPGSNTAYVLNRGGVTADNRVSVVDASDPKNPFVAATITVGAAPYALVFSDDGYRAVVTSVVDHSIHVIDAQAHVELTELGGLVNPCDVTFLTGQRVAVVADASTGPSLALVDTDTFLVTPFDSTPAPVTAVASAPSGDWIYGLSFKRGVLLRFASDGSSVDERLMAFPPFLGTDVGPDPTPRPLVSADTPAGPRVFAAGAGGMLLSFDRASGEAIGHLDFGGEIASIDYNAALDKLVVTVGATATKIDPNVLYFGMLDPDRDLVEVEPPTDPTPVMVGDGQFGDLIVLVDDGLSNCETSFAVQGYECWRPDSNGVCEELRPLHDKNGWSIWRPETANVVREFYTKADDVFDFVLVFYGSDWRYRLDAEGWPIDIEEYDAGATHEWVRNFTVGLACPEGSKDGRIGNLASKRGFPTTRLQSVLYLNDLGEYDADGTAGSRERNGWAILAHELAHRFGAFVDLPAPEGSILDEHKQHWSRELDSGGSVLGGIMGNDFVDLGEIPDEAPLHRFQVTARESCFGLWDLYLMGRLATSHFLANADCYRIGGAMREDELTGKRERLGSDIPYEVDDVVVGERVDVHAASVSDPAVWGERSPDASLSQDTFRIGVCIVVPAPQAGPATVPRGDLYEVRSLIADLQSCFAMQHHENDAGGRLVADTGVAGDASGDIALGSARVSHGVSLAEGKRLYLADLTTDSVLVMDTESGSGSYGTILQEIALPAGTPGQVFVRPDETQLYVVDQANAVVRVVDIASASYVGDISLPATASGGASVAVGRTGPAANLAFVGTRGGIATLDLENDQFVEMIPPPCEVHDLALTGDGEVLVYTHAAFPRVYWTTMETYPNGVRRAYPIEDLAFGYSDPARIALDVAGGKMYWTVYHEGSIHRANLDGSDVEDLITGLDPHTHGIALDIPQGKMYFSVRGKIQRANLDGSNVEDLITGLGWLRGAALDLAASKIYWIDYSPGSQKIQRANLDGTNVEDLVTSGLSRPGGLALDLARGKMYISESRDWPYEPGAIFRADLDGSNFEDISPDGLDDPRDVAVDSPAQMFYYSELGYPYRIVRAEMYGSKVETVVVDQEASGIAIDTSMVGDYQITAYSVATGQRQSFSDDLYHQLALVQLESNPNHDRDRAFASTSPPALVYVNREYGLQVFDLTVDPTSTGEDPRFEFSPLGVPDIAFNWWDEDDVVFSRAGEYAVTSLAHSNYDFPQLVINIINVASHEVVDSSAIWEDGFFVFRSKLIPSQDGERVFVVREDHLLVLR
ncbi:MAG: hypothetical protein AB1486_15980 [Planctomycetota bacterium]